VEQEKRSGVMKVYTGNDVFQTQTERMINFSFHLLRNSKFNSSSSPIRRYLSSSSSSSPYSFINPQELFFLANEFLPQEFFMKLERYQDQNPQIYENIMNTACDIANQYHYPLREVCHAP
jgi:hypothetical protein